MTQEEWRNIIDDKNIEFRRKIYACDAQAVPLKRRQEAHRLKAVSSSHTVANVRNELINC